MPEGWSGVPVVGHEDAVKGEEPRLGRLDKGVVVRDPCPGAVGFEVVAPDGGVPSCRVESFGQGLEGELFPALRGDHFADAGPADEAGTVAATEPGADGPGWWSFAPEARLHLLGATRPRRRRRRDAPGARRCAGSPPRGCARVDAVCR